jgi:glycosyltransferase involved in cell wall biosynthesis
MATEASFLATGYSTYSMEVQKRLHATGKYELAEFGCYAHTDDPRASELPWKFFGNLPDLDNAKQVKDYGEFSVNQFGGYRFNDTALKFRPDIVWDIRDHWMSEFVERSPFRKYFQWAIMPTVDSVPQREQWLATYIDADRVLAYTDWGLRTLQDEGGGLIKTARPAPPAADTDAYDVMDKKLLRKRFGFREDLNIIGTVMRNQPRKLYPELIDAFADLLRQLDPDTAKRTFLYLHTTYPDNGWDIPTLIKRAGVSGKVLMTYVCRTCRYIAPAFFSDARATCGACGKRNAMPPSTQVGIDHRMLAEIINLFDVYVQYANCEGFGMPQVEAAACGVPVMAVDYSAMSDVVRKVNGYPIKVLTYKMDFDLGCKRAIPDNADLVAKLLKFFSLSEGQRKEKSHKARQGVLKHYTWDKTTKVWEDVFDSMPLRDLSETWESPPRLHTPAPNVPAFNTSEEFVRWTILNILGRPEMLNSYMAIRLIRDLNWGAAVSTVAGNYFNEASHLGQSAAPQEFTPENAVNLLTKMCLDNNRWERLRCGVA